MSTEAVVGADSIVGFTRAGHHSELVGTIDRAEQTRDIMSGNRFESEQLRDAIADNAVAIEKIGAAGQITAEKIGAANQLAVEKVGAANTLAMHQLSSNLQLQACNNFAEVLKQVAGCCCEVKELIHEDGQKTRDLVNSIERDRNAVALVDAKQELLLAKLSRGNGHS